ncbi:MAG: endolytic transglycosylase MltG [Bacillota bacterium]|nr:endolytic transglycosylase MltG [Bacillota bacterium]
MKEQTDCRVKGWYYMKIFFKSTRNIIAAALLAVVILCAFFATNGFHGFGQKDRSITFAVSKGMTGREISASLKKEGAVRCEAFFRIALKFSGQPLKAGTYELSPKMSYSEIISTLTGHGIDTRIRVTIPEGYRITQIAETFEKKGLVSRKDFLNEVAVGQFNYSFISADLPAGETRLEGYLFPDTYFFEKGTSAHVIIDTMLREFGSVFGDKLYARTKELGYSPREIVILASVIEKEGSSDLAEISSVFHNRLKTGMRLESCATVNYLFDKPKNVLSYKDTHIDSPYNTYRNSGLPPAPICSPGVAALEAALYPADTNYLYFIADGKGKNLFSATYEEHLKKKRSLH